MNILFHTNAPMPKPFHTNDPAFVPSPKNCSVLRDPPLNLATPPGTFPKQKVGGVYQNFGMQYPSNLVGSKFIEAKVIL